MQYSMFNIAKYISGNGAIEKLREYKGKRIGIVTDQSIIDALNLGERLYKDILSGCEYEVLANIQSEPDMAVLADPIEKTRSFAPEVIAALGGGAVMDAAKALWLFYELPDYDWERAMKPYEVEPFPGKAILVAIPTTSGTGSETTGCAVIKGMDKSKRMILSNEIIPTLAIMDFDVLQSLTPRGIAFSGTDALAHALEAGVSVLSSTMVRMQCIQAAVTLIRELPKSFAGDLNARERVHIAATMAGMGINNAITGMAHGMDQAGGDFSKPHGLMTGMLLPYTMEFLAPQPLYQDVAEQLGLGSQEALIDAIWALYDTIQLPKTLQEIGIPEKEYLEKISGYIASAQNNANIMFAPKKPTDSDLEALYKKFYYGRTL